MADNIRISNEFPEGKFKVVYHNFDLQQESYEIIHCLDNKYFLVKNDKGYEIYYDKTYFKRIF